MSSTKQPSRYTGVERRAPRPEATGPGFGPGISRDAYVSLLKRNDRVGGRHAAITTSLYSWHSYKNWAEKMRGNFDEKK